MKSQAVIDELYKQRISSDLEKGVRIENRNMRFLEKFNFRQKLLTSLQFRKASNFEFAKLGCFGSITWVNDLV